MLAPSHLYFVQRENFEKTLKNLTLESNVFAFTDGQIQANNKHLYAA
jgi:hypothetical protein